MTAGRLCTLIATQDNLRFQRLNSDSDGLVTVGSIQTLLLKMCIASPVAPCVFATWSEDRTYHAHCSINRVLTLVQKCYQSRVISGTRDT